MISWQLPSIKASPMTTPTIYRRSAAPIREIYVTPKFVEEMIAHWDRWLLTLNEHPGRVGAGAHQLSTGLPLWVSRLRFT